MHIAYSTHLGQRLRERKMSRNQVDATLQSPDTRTSSKGGWRYTKVFASNQTVTVVTTRTSSGSELVVSAWIDPPNKGTRDEKKRQIYSAYKRAKGVLKWWYALRVSLGL